MSDLMLKLVLSWLDVSLLCVLIPVAIGGRIRISRCIRQGTQASQELAAQLPCADGLHRGFSTGELQ
jgi:hypothetical protein